MKSVNEASLALVREDVSLLQNKGELFDMAKRKVHEMGYSYAKQSSRSKVFGDSNPENPTVIKKRNYIPSNIREERINELSESITSANETIQLLLKQKEQYANIDKFEQAADVNTTILQRVKEKRQLQKELKALQEAGEKSKKYKKKKKSQSNEGSSHHGLKQKRLSWGGSSMSSQSSGKGDESSGADTLILSDNESSPGSLQNIDEIITDKECPNFWDGPK